MSLRICTNVSSLVGSGLGSVTLEHSWRSVTRRLLSSYIFSTGSKVSLLFASCSSINSCSSGVNCISSFSFSSVSSSCSPISLCLEILSLAYDSSWSKSSPPSWSGSRMENLGCILSTFFTSSESVTFPTQVASFSKSSILSNFSLSKMLRDAYSFSSLGILSSFSSLSSLYLNLRCSSFLSYHFLYSAFFSSASFLSLFILLLYLFEFFPSILPSLVLASSLLIIFFLFSICSSRILTSIEALTTLDSCNSLIFGFCGFFKFPFKPRLNSSISANPTFIFISLDINSRRISVTASSVQISDSALKSCPSILAGGEYHCGCGVVDLSK